MTSVVSAPEKINYYFREVKIAQSRINVIDPCHECRRKWLDCNGRYCHASLVADFTVVSCGALMSSSGNNCDILPDHHITQIGERQPHLVSLRVRSTTTTTTTTT